MLTLRRTGLSSPAYRDLVDCIVIQEGRAVGRIYEDRQTLPDLRWFWSITIYVNPKQGITTSGRAASLEGAKANFYRTRRSAAPARLRRVSALSSADHVVASARHCRRGLSR